MKCLEKKIANRYPTAQALANDLKRLRATLAAKPASVPPRVSLPSVVLVAPGGKQVRLSSQTTVVGRAAECDLVIKAADVSKRHCRIVLAPDSVVVEDLGSSNGTLVNGEQVKRASLKDGDQLDLGGHLFQVRMRESSARPRPRPPGAMPRAIPCRPFGAQGRANPRERLLHRNRRRKALKGARGEPGARPRADVAPGGRGPGRTWPRADVAPGGCGPGRTWPRADVAPGGRGPGRTWPRADVAPGGRGPGQTAGRVPRNAGRSLTLPARLLSGAPQNSLP